MYTVLKTGGKQYRAVQGQKLRIEKGPQDQGILEFEGEQFSASGMSKVLVRAQALGVFKQEKVIIFKKNRRHNYRRTRGHRQSLLHIQIISIEPHAA